MRYCIQSQNSHKQEDKRYDINRGDCDEEIEKVNISLPDAFGNPHAVMIIPINTDIACSAMICLSGSLHSTHLTKFVFVSSSYFLYSIVLFVSNRWIGEGN